MCINQQDYARSIRILMGINFPIFMIFLLFFKEVVCGFAGYLYRINLGLVLRLSCIYRRPLCYALDITGFCARAFGLSALYDTPPFSFEENPL